MNKNLFRLFLYIMPAVADCVTGIFYFIGPVRATLLGYDPLVAGGAVTARSLCVCVASVVFARFLFARNSVFWMFASLWGMIAVCFMSLWADNILMIYLTCGLNGAFSVVFSAAFQIFMTAVDADESKPLARVVGSYTLAWCVGMSLGPFITGALMATGKADGEELSFGWFYTYLVAAGLLLVNFLFLLFVVRKSAGVMSRHVEALSQPRPESGEEDDHHPDWSWLGWIMAVIGTLALGIVNGVFPSGATEAGMPEWQSGLVMMLLALAMGVFAYAVAVPRGSMYSAGYMAVIGLMGTLGMVAIAIPGILGRALTEHVWPFYAGAVLFGAYAGITYLYSAFHSLIHPDVAGRNISLNESFLAAGMIIGPLVGGWMAREYGFFVPFVLGAALVLALGIFQFVAHSRFPLRDPE